MQNTHPHSLRLSTEEAAALLGRSPRTLEGWRLENKGPPYTKIEGEVFYTRPAIIEWLMEQTHFPREVRTLPRARAATTANLLRGIQPPADDPPPQPASAGWNWPDLQDSHI